MMYFTPCTSSFTFPLSLPYRGNRDGQAKGGAGSIPCRGKKICSSSKQPDQLQGPPKFLLNVYRRLLRRAGTLTTHLSLVPSLKMSGAIALLPAHAFVVYTGKALLLSKASENGYKLSHSQQYIRTPLIRKTGMASYPDMQKIQITGFFFENRLYWQYGVETNFYKRLFQATYLFLSKVIPLQARCGPKGGQRYSSTLP